MKPNESRILYTGDPTFLFHDSRRYNPGGRPYTAAIIDSFVGLLAASGVDTHLVCPNTQVAWYPSRTAPVVWDGYERGDREFFRAQARLDVGNGPKLEEHIDRCVESMGHYLDLVESGLDWVAETADACRRHGIRPWLSVRMNDMHNAGDPVGSHLSCPLFKDPQYRLSGKPPGTGAEKANGYFAGLNYARPEVRDYMFDMIRELIDDYDYEGMSLDWVRNPLCCEPTASQTETDIMTGWIGQIRDHARKQAARKGRDFSLGLRMTGGLELMRAIGLDVRAWAAAGHIDFVTLSNFLQTSWDIPHDRMRQQLRAEPPISIYGCVDSGFHGVQGTTPETGVIGTRMLPLSAPAMRANAAGKLALGADGIELFNFFVPDSAMTFDGPRSDSGIPLAEYGTVHELGRLETLAGSPKHYALATGLGFGSLQAYEFACPLPVQLEAGCQQAFALPMSAEPADADLELVVQVVVKKQDEPYEIGVGFNGGRPLFASEETSSLLFPSGALTHHLPENRAFNFGFGVERIENGWNDLVVYNDVPHTGKRRARARRGEETLCIVSVEVAVRRSKRTPVCF